MSHPVGRAVRLGVRTTAELVLTLGLVVVLLAVYLVVWSDVQAAAAQSELRAAFAVASAAPPGGSSPGTAVPPPAAPSFPTSPLDPGRLPGEDLPTGGPSAASSESTAPAVAVLHAHRLGADWSWVVVGGVSRADLKRGPGHFPGTAAPGQVGNFAVAGHRSTSGEPFKDLDRLRPGDHVVVQTVDAWYDYVVDRQEIVDPSAVEVLAPVPQRPGATPAEAALTLVTCHPRWGSTSRLVVFADLAGVRTAAEGPPAALAA